MANVNYGGASPARPQPLRYLQHAGNVTTCGTFTPEDGMTVAIVVGRNTPIEVLTRLARRHGIEPQDLALFATAQ